MIMFNNRTHGVAIAQGESLRGSQRPRAAATLRCKQLVVSHGVCMALYYCGAAALEALPRMLCQAFYKGRLLPELQACNQSASTSTKPCSTATCRHGLLQWLLTALLGLRHALVRGHSRVQIDLLAAGRCRYATLTLQRMFQSNYLKTRT
jgi:hypothetical protein